ncbi:TOMM precursor leader peptide-binding protein [Nonomuraea angiospora]|uniref:Bacteriocin biosynthesis cyclodehydratase domain-containing protein n=1 Tax=Nonomuraea angiospora TaxID=46172 RepID=A0ABR9LQZ0_9ACTN|nr:TOMM precursor leader peptide-binding protein [Nonomuraea angiospora]MBE1583071.1 bacteriocin biosynthesis cyclodehydratase domain-containing protein [Nonomuraea angiospora]
MAATVRVIAVGQGPFGARVADRLRDRPPGARFTADGLDARFTAGDLDAVFAAGAQVVVVALWRPAPGLCERADELAHATGTAWLPVVMEDASIVVGPLVRPGSGPCFRCFADRRVQHDPRWHRTRARYAAYDSDPALGPAGFRPRHADVAATAARLLLRPAGDGPGRAARDAARDAAGAVITLSVPGLSVSRDRVVACHGCDRCGRQRPVRDLRRLLRLEEWRIPQ